MLLPLTGCPGVPSLAYGVWFFTTQNISSVPVAGIGQIIMQNGFTTPAPPGYPGDVNTFGGPLTWQQSGNMITLVMDLDPDFIFTGTIESSTSMSGTFRKDGDTTPQGTWSAEYGPDN